MISERGILRAVGCGWAAVVLLAGFDGQAVAVAIAARVAVIKSSSIPPFDEAATEMAHVLREHPLQPEILMFTLDGDARKNATMVREVEASRPALIVTVGSLATNLVLNESLLLPVVFSMVLYPEQSGFVGRPGRRVTGASLDVPHEIQFSHLRRLLPAARRIGVLYHPDETRAVVEAAAAAAPEHGFTMVAEVVEEPGQAVAALGRLTEKADVIWAVADSHVFAPQTTAALILAALRRRVPLIGLSNAHVRAGALAALYCDYKDVGRQTAEIVARVLQGEDAAAIPVTKVRAVKLALNLRTAEHLGVTITRALEGEAGEVVR
jgi:putative ABC transport system substrate-binding protein